MNEAKALRELKQGSQQAMEWFIEKYNAYVSTIVHNIIGQHMSFADTEEAVSDVFLALWKNAGKVRPGMVQAYIGTVARNAAKKKLRECQKDTVPEDDVLVIDMQTPEHALEQAEVQQLVRQAVLSMTQPDREIFLRYYFYCQTVDMICAEMKMTQSAVKSRLSRGREKIKTTLMDNMQ